MTLLENIFHQAENKPKTPSSMWSFFSKVIVNTDSSDCSKTQKIYCIMNTN